MRLRSLTIMVFIISALAGISGHSAAASGTSIGIRAGYSFDPDQFVVGSQAIYGRVFRIARLGPSVDLGLGDKMTTITFNLDARLFLTPPKASTSLYFGMGPTIAIFDPDEGEGDTEVGLTLASGIRMALGGKHFYNLEGRLGIGDVPEVKILVGVLLWGGSKPRTVP